MGARPRSRPRQVTVWYRGIPYTLDLVRCRRAFVDRQVDGELSSVESLANAVGISRSTTSRFFSGRPTSLTITLQILTVLRLTFEDVARVIAVDELAELDADAMALLERLARMGRAEGIILITVTQRPSADVLGGLDGRTDDGPNRAGRGRAPQRRADPRRRPAEPGLAS